MKAFLGVGAELPQQAVMVGLLDGHRLKPVFREAQQAGVGIGHQERRMGRHDDLADGRLLHPA
jgi:hypothetical protein